MPPRYRVTLTSEERKELELITRSGKTRAKRFINASALLLCVGRGTSLSKWKVIVMHPHSH